MDETGDNAESIGEKGINNLKTPLDEIKHLNGQSVLDKNTDVKKVLKNEIENQTSNQENSSGLEVVASTEGQQGSDQDITKTFTENGCNGHNYECSDKMDCNEINDFSSSQNGTAETEENDINNTNLNTDADKETLSSISDETIKSDITEIRISPDSPNIDTESDSSAMDVVSKEVDEECKDYEGNDEKQNLAQSNTAENMTVTNTDKQNGSDGNKKVSDEIIHKSSTTKSPFVISDKVRQSLKGLAEKVNLPDLKTVEGESKTNNSLHTEQSMLVDDKTENEEDDIILAASSEEGLTMEIGSDNEDELLNSPDEKLNKSQEKVERESDQLTSKVQFDDDSNSNSNPSKFNEIMSFLHKDISGTNSPIVLDQSDDLTDDTNSSVGVGTEKKDLQDNKTASDFIKIDTKTVEKAVAHLEKDQINIDDDVIFDGESKIEPQSKSTDLSNGADQKVTENKTVAKSSVKQSVDNSGDSTQDSIVVEDDDIIFEKETKVDTNKDKQKVENSTECDSNVNKDDGICKIPKEETVKKEIKPDKKEIKDEDLTILSVKESERDIDRKRPAEDIEEVKDVKRTKLEQTDVKTDEMPENKSIELIDTDDEETETDEETRRKNCEKQYTYQTAEGTVSYKDGVKYITMTEDELEARVRKKVKAYLITQNDAVAAKMTQKLKELQTNNDLWKKQVRDLQNKVFEVTVLQQKLEKRKAKTAALRQITTRNVGIQVDEGKITSGQSKPKQQSAAPTPTKTVTSPAPVVSTPPAAGRMIRLPIPQSSLAPPMLTTQATQPSQPGQMASSTYKAPTVKSLLDTTRVQPTIGSPVVTATTTPTSVISLIQYPPRFIAQNSSAPQNFYAVPQTAGTQVSTSKVVTKTVAISGNKVIDLTDDEDSSKTRLVALTTGVAPSTSAVSGIRHVLPPGAQLVRSALPNTAYQLVFNSSPPAIRPTVVTGLASLPQNGTLLQPAGVSQSNVVNLASPTGAILTQGTNLARAAAVPPVIQQTAQPSPPKTHPAPFPPLPPSQPNDAALKAIPPKPSLKISRVSQGIVLSWNMNLTDGMAEIASYQLFAYQETSAQPSINLWKKVGDVKALPLPMACTLTQFQVGNKYHFAVRAMDIHSRVGNFSDASSIYLTAVVTSN